MPFSPRNHHRANTKWRITHLLKKEDPLGERFCRSSEPSSRNCRAAIAAAIDGTEFQVVIYLARSSETAARPASRMQIDISFLSAGTRIEVGG